MSATNTGPGYITDKRALLIRLHRIQGQVRGVERMVEADAHCIDILTQVSAATRALQSLALMLLDEHVRRCVTDASGPEDAEVRLKAAEVSAAVARLVRS